MESLLTEVQAINDDHRRMQIEVDEMGWDVLFDPFFFFFFCAQNPTSFGSCWSSGRLQRNKMKHCVVESNKLIVRLRQINR